MKEKEIALAGRMRPSRCLAVAKAMMETARESAPPAPKMNDTEEVGHVLC